VADVRECQDEPNHDHRHPTTKQATARTLNHCSLGIATRQKPRKDSSLPDPPVFDVMCRYQTTRRLAAERAHVLHDGVTREASRSTSAEEHKHFPPRSGGGVMYPATDIGRDVAEVRDLHCHIGRIYFRDLALCFTTNANIVCVNRFGTLSTTLCFLIGRAGA
jgi:hypothetical protein